MSKEQDIAKLEKVLDDNKTEDLQGYAAEAAMDVLTQNWRDAIRDGTPLSKLIPDVDLVIEHLQAYKRDLLK